ncbi:uncharacterized protein Dana_GF22769 [Drosophila ananassae]|uniref:Uncharacterized protein n=1 Tax=Drosophila ananassae TaxID=7217 RepID=B3MUV6_DROAN|nr:uncharacterized protein LOC6505422 [Drosophila ananassae]EDV33021.1 uncharacterized protein Dana_GF22769 [Drosophila ananassae]
MLSPPDATTWPIDASNLTYLLSLRGRPITDDFGFDFSVDVAVPAGSIGFWLTAWPKDQWSISAKMVDSLTTRYLLATLLMALGFCVAVTKDSDSKWMAPLGQYGYTAKHLKNKVEHGEFTTFELGTPNYQILNPEAEPEYITADQPHYQEMLRRLTSGQSGAETIDVEMAGRTGSSSQEHPSSTASPIKKTKESTPDRWEKVRKRSSFKTEDEEKDTQEAEAVNVHSLHPKIQVYAGARPFQSLVANLN